MLSGELDKALAAIHRAFAMAAEFSIAVDSGVDMVCSPRISGLLVASGITTIGQLTQWTAEELLTIPQLGWQSIASLEENLAEFGFTLRT